MPCQLTPSAGEPAIIPGTPSGPSSFDGSQKTKITIFADSDSGTVHVTAAHLNGANLPLDANSKASFDVIVGLNILRMAFVGSDPDEVFRINEDCGDGTSTTLRTWRLRVAVPGGATTQITINGT